MNQHWRRRALRRDHLVDSRPQQCSEVLLRKGRSRGSPRHPRKRHAAVPESSTSSYDAVHHVPHHRTALARRAKEAHQAASGGNRADSEERYGSVTAPANGAPAISLTAPLQLPLLAPRTWRSPGFAWSRGPPGSGPPWRGSPTRRAPGPGTLAIAALGAARPALVLPVRRRYNIEPAASSS